ncbi:WD40 repeat domain-containing protein [Amycolatopsis sp. CA-128772]|uniref:WD40 repeat domain-containing protein n=1 Tax=Amycolatopsis sp. CA-128772 TaxID=2073159 RepID=UPI000CCFD740|nr:WD40 repeat domain-containing protein [Amycolatopsis sp. CA-128772]
MRGSDPPSNTVFGEVSGTVIQAGQITGGLHLTPAAPRPRTSPAARLAQRPPWLARLRHPGGGTAGAAVLVDDRHVVTCARVLPGGPSGEVEVEFPCADPPLVRRARVLASETGADGLAGDVTVVRLTDSVRLTPAPLATPAAPDGHECWMHGFPDDSHAVRRLTGHVAGVSGPHGRWFELDPGPVDEGASVTGTPVFDRDADAVIGIVAPREDRRWDLLPVPYLCRWWPSLAGLVRWRLDLDPSVKTHWLPRARGSEVENDAGRWYFTGRSAARQAIGEWLDEPGTPVLVVAGGPGTGKSALLAHLLVASDPLLGSAVPATAPQPRRGAFDIGIHVAGLTRDDVMQRLAATIEVEAATPRELLAAARERHQSGHRPLTVLADAVEEAANTDEAVQIAALLRSLAGTGAVRVLAGVRTAPAGSDRARILAAFGTAGRRLIDLESREFLRNHDVAEYVQHRLVGEETGPVRYRHRPEADLRTIGRAVARKAGYNFLIAQLVTRWLTHPTTAPLDLGDPAWTQGLPETIGQAMDAYLDTCGADAALVRRLLTALAFARGSGLPRERDRTWLTIADALHPNHAHTPAELETVFHSAANYLVERVNDHQIHSTYRLYHDALDEHLRTGLAVKEPQRAIVAALTQAVPERDGRRQWAAAAPYTRAHLAGHAALAHDLDRLLEDSGYLLNADPGPLLATLGRTTTDRGELIATVYRLSVHRHRQAGPVTRCRVLALDAVRLGVGDLRDRLTAEQDALADGSGWRAAYATGHNLPSHTIAVLTGHTGVVRAIAAAEVDGRPVAITGGTDRDVRLWDLAQQYRIGEPLAGHTAAVLAVAATDVDGRPVAVTAGEDRVVRLWDLAGHRPFGVPLVGHTGAVFAVAATDVDGRPVAVTAGEDRVVRLWDLAEQRRLGVPLAGHTGAVFAVAAGDVEGRAVAMTAGDDQVVHVWDLAERRGLGQVRVPELVKGPRFFHAGTDQGIPASVSAVRAGLVDQAVLFWKLTVWRRTPERPVLSVTASGEDLIAAASYHRPAVEVWNLPERAQVGAQQPGTDAGHAPLSAVTTLELDGRRVVIVGAERNVEVWDLAGQRRIGAPVTGHVRPVTAVGVAGVGDKVFAMTAGACSLRLWDVPGRAHHRRLLTGHGSAVTAIAVAEAGDRPVAVTAAGPFVQVWDFTTHRPIGSLPVADDQPVTTLAVADLRGRPIAFAGGSGGVWAWDVFGGFPVGRRRTGEPVTAVAAAALDGHPVVVTATAHAVRAWHLTGQRPVSHLHDGSVTALAVTELAGRPLAVMAADSVVHVRDIGTGRPLGRPFTAHTGPVPVLTAALLDGRPVVVSGSHDRTIRVWDPESGECFDTLTLPDRISAMALSRTGTLVVGFGYDIAVFETPVRGAGVPSQGLSAAGPARLSGALRRLRRP